MTAIGICCIMKSTFKVYVRSDQVAMRKILIGSIILFISINLPIENVSIGLLPNCVGYLLMIAGIRELRRKEPIACRQMRTAEIVMKIWFVAVMVILACKAFRIYVPAGDVGESVCSLLFALGECYCWKRIIEALGILEKAHGWELNTLRLGMAWWIYGVTAVSNALMIFVTVPIIYGIILGLTITVPIYFAVQLYRANKAYQKVVRLAAQKGGYDGKVHDGH